MAGGRSPGWTAPSLGRYKPAILAVTVVALGYTLYYISEQLWSRSQPAKGALHRSDAHRRPHRRRASSRAHGGRRHAVHPEYDNNNPWGTVLVSLEFLTDSDANDREYGDHIFQLRAGHTTTTPLRRHMFSESELIHTIAADREEAREIRKQLEEGFLKLYFLLHIPPSPISQEQKDSIMAELTRDGDFNPENIDAALEEHQSRLLEGSIERWDRDQDARRQARLPIRPSLPSDLTAEALQRRGALAGAGTLTDVDSEQLVEAHRKVDQDTEVGNEGQSLLNLLYRMMEDQAKQEGYVHRRVSCNGCSVMPIRGVRYRCSNCLDYDLCELCEATHIHPKTHLFYKIRIPAPFLGHPRQPEPVQYPGKPPSDVINLTKDSIRRMCDVTGYQTSEIEAFWEQFKCLAATEWPDDPNQYKLAIDRHTFDKCFVPNTSIRPPPTNLLYDRMFSYYDQDNDGFIGFDEFVEGLASLTHKHTDERLLRIFGAYDSNNDGFVDRGDFLEMFKGYYAATKELTREVLVDMEDHVSDNASRVIVHGSQPISSSFAPDADRLPRAEPSRSGQGKGFVTHGDLRIRDDMGAVDELDHDMADPDDMFADDVEAAQYGSARPKHMIGSVDFSMLYVTPWPPSAVIWEDIEKTLHNPLRLEEILDPMDQHAVRTTVHARLARDHQQRQHLRRLVIRERRQNRRGASPDRLPWIDTPKASDTIMMEDFQVVRQSNQYDAFCASFIEAVEELHWPVDSPVQLMDDVLQVLSDCWTGDAIVEDFSGYGSVSVDSKIFLRILTRLLSEAVNRVTSDEPVQSVPNSRRSESSSNFRVQDDLGTNDEHEKSSIRSIASRSMPNNERLGAFKILEPEPDVGREVLHQVTEVALNELIDSIFNLREGLGTAVRGTQHVRDQNRAKIVNAVQHPFGLKRLLDYYQRRWRRDPDFATASEPPAVTFLEFLHQEAAGQETSLTAERCPRCASAGEDKWVKLGEDCTCRFLSTGRRLEITPVDFCPTCAGEGIAENIGGINGGFLCGRCGTPSQKCRKEMARLQAIIAGPETGFPMRMGHDVGTAQEQPRDEAVQGSQQPPAPPNAEAVKDLANSVSAFDQADPPSLEQAIAQKPLDALLQDAGYVAIPSTGPSRNASPPPDPTLPQNMPNTISSDDHRPLRNRLNSLSELTTEQRENLDGLETNQGLATASTPLFLEGRRRGPSLANHTQRVAALRALAGNGALVEDPEDETDAPVPDNDMLRWYACLDLIKAEDEERGGPGRLNFEEWEEVMKGNKGPGLGFLCSWIEMAGF